MSLAAYTAKTWTDYADSPDLSAANVQYMDSGIAAVTAEVIALELALPTTYQPISAELSALAGLSSTGYAKRTGAGAWSVSATIPATDLTGTIAAARMPALTGDVTSTVGTVATSIAASVVTGKALTGYAVGANSALAATDTILAAMGKLQGQINDKPGISFSRTAKTFFAAPNAANGAAVWRTIVASDLPVSGVTAGAYGSASVVPVPTVDAYGRITAMSTATITPASIGAQVAGSYESTLGSPGTDGWLLSSTATGVRSWVAPYAHPATHQQSVVDSSTGWITTALAGKQAAGNYLPIAAGSGSPLTGDLYAPALRVTADGAGVNFFDSTRIYKAAGGGLRLRSNSGNVRPMFEDSAGTAFTIWDAGNLAFGTVAGSMCQGNDSRLVNGQTAYSWGNHASAGYATAASLANYLPLTAGSGKPLTGALYGTTMVMSTGGTAPSVGLYAWPAVPASRTFIGLSAQDGTTGSWAGTTGLVLWADSAVLSGVVTAGINAGGVSVISATSSVITLAATLNGTSAAFTGAIQAASLKLTGWTTGVSDVVLPAPSTASAGIVVSGSGTQQTQTFAQVDANGALQRRADIAANGASFDGAVYSGSLIGSVLGASDTLGSASRLAVTNSMLDAGWCMAYGASALHIWHSASAGTWGIKALIRPTGAAEFGGSVAIHTASVSGSMQIGEWVGGSGFAAIANRSAWASSGSYAMLASATGETWLNAASGKPMHFRIGNGSDLAFLDSTSFNISGRLSVSPISSVSGDGVVTLTAGSRDGEVRVYSATTFETGSRPSFNASGCSIKFRTFTGQQLYALDGQNTNLRADAVSGGNRPAWFGEAIMMVWNATTSTWTILN